MTLVKMDHVSKNYRLGDTTVHALKEVSLDVFPGDFMSVWGPSGSGKTTLLNLIGTIDEPTSGNVTINGNAVSSLSDDEKSNLRNRSIGFIFQGFNLVPVLSALENVMLPLQIRGESALEAREKSFRRLAQVGLSDFVRHRPDKLSGGQQQRVSIARALVTKPSLVIADEPTGNLDPDTSDEILKLLYHLNQNHNTTIIFTTHDYRLMEQYPSRVIRCYQGKIFK